MKAEVGKAVYEGEIVFGPVRVPVRAYKVHTDENGEGFFEVHAEDKGQIGRKKYCKLCGKDLPWQGHLKAVEVDDTLVTFTEDELKRLKPGRRTAMRIIKTLPLDDIPAHVYTGTAWYLGTGSKKKTSGQPFALLRESLKSEGKVALVAWVERSTARKETFAVLMPHGSGFLLRQLASADHTRSIEDIEVIEAKVSKELLAKGRKLVRKLAGKFKHDDIVDTYSKEFERIVLARLEGKEEQIEERSERSEEEELLALLSEE